MFPSSVHVFSGFCGWADGSCSNIPQPFCTIQLPLLPIVRNHNNFLNFSACLNFEGQRHLAALGTTLTEEGHIAKRARACFPTSPQTRFRLAFRPLPLLPSSQLLSTTISRSPRLYSPSSRRRFVFISSSLFPAPFFSYTRTPTDNPTSTVSGMKTIPDRGTKGPINLMKQCLRHDWNRLPS